MAPGKLTTAIIIPVLNEADSLLTVLAEMPFASGEVEIIVVDGGSTDGTPALAEKAGARVVHEPRRGYGRACAAGSAATGADILVYMDGDGSNVPADIVRLLAGLEQPAGFCSDFLRGHVGQLAALRPTENTAACAGSRRID